MSLLASYQGLSKSYGAQVLFTDISIMFHKGDRIGLIGSNGSGKSTLLKIFSGNVTPDEGEYTQQKHLKMSYLSQSESFDPEKTVSEVLFESVSEDSAEEEHIRYKKVDKLVGQALFPDPDQKAGSLSGGWRKRLAICCCLVKEPDLLLMDEPTNHLDLSGILWLEKYLKESRLSYVVVSHDRYFLENVTTKTVELGRCFPGGYFKVEKSYISYVRHREEFLENQQKQEASLANRMRRETEWLRRGPKARTTKAKFRIDDAGKLGEQLAEVKQRNNNNRSINIDFHATGRKTKKLMDVQFAGKSMGGKKLFENITFRLSPGSRMGLLGGNGTGKSTFINLLRKNLSPDSGQVSWAENLRVAAFDQDRLQLDPEITLKKALSPDGDSVIFRDRSYHVASWAQRFLFRPDHLEMPVGRLSGGEQARIMIANLMRQPADVLLLDEPTNDLDIPSLEILEESIADFPGAVVLVTHDRYLLDNLTDTVLGFDGKGNAEFYADFRQWTAAVEEEKPEKKKAETPKKKNSSGDTKVRKKAGKLSYKDQYELDHMEENILVAEEELEKRQNMLNLPETAADPDLLSECCVNLQKAQETVDCLYARWEELESMKEASL